MRRAHLFAFLVGSISAPFAGCGDAPPSAPEHDPIPAPPGLPHGDTSDPALLADPVALRAAFGLPGDSSPAAFSVFDPFIDSEAHDVRAITPQLNTTCPPPELVTWHHQTVSPGADITWATAASCNSVYEVGFTNRALNDPRTPNAILPWAGQNDLYIIRRNVNGIPFWAKQIGTTSSDFATAVVTTPCNDPFMYVAGHSSGSLGNPNSGGSDIVLFKFADDGTEIWRTQFGSTQNEQVWAVTLDTDGNIYVAGQSSGNLPGSGVTFPSGTTSLFVIKYDPSGNIIWTRQHGVNNRTTVARGLTSAGGALYVTGFTSVGFDSQAFAGGSFDAFIVKYDSAGNRMSSNTKFISTPAFDQGYGITTRVEGTNTFLYVTGYTNGTLPGQVNVGLNSFDIFVSKFDTNLEPVWTDQFGGSTSVVANSGNIIAFTGRKVVVAGGTDREVDGSNNSLGSFDIVLVSYDVDGTKSRIDYMGTNTSEAAHALANDSSGNLFIGGRTDGSFCGHSFGGGGVDGLLFRHSPGCLVNSPNSSCKIGGGSGDPHYVTFDGFRYDNQGAGNFIMAQAIGTDDFQVQVRQCPLSPTARVSLMNAVGMRIGPDTVEYNALGEYYINGNLTSVPGAMALPNGGAIYPAIRGGTVFAWPDGHRVVANAFGPYMNVSVIIESSLIGRVEGFLGNADNDGSNEFSMTRDGSDVRDSLTFFDLYKAQPSFNGTWRVQGTDERLITHGTDCTDEIFPGQPTWLHDLTPAQRAAGEAACAGIADEIAREPCILDVGLTGDPMLATVAMDAAAQLINQGVVAPAQPSPRTVYFNDFVGTIGLEWDSIVTTTTPLNDRTFLGSFGNETVRLTLNNLSRHTEITVSFNLYIINGWDGDGPFGPNVWKAAADGQEVANYTFSNTLSTQSFPMFGSSAGAGATETNTLFYPFGGFGLPHQAHAPS